MLNWTTISSSSMHVHISYLCLDQPSSPMAQEIRYMCATFIYLEILRMLADIHGVQLLWPNYIEHCTEVVCLERGCRQDLIVFILCYR
ncbi:hypothetical protein QJS04_geneDACA016789 [Acorus gramineus]|uniref:Uncharacterized protein n=1 Tax=Acorus gramineus TaxID=55184 RepID=A0AAV9BJ51_ACOGR|nr:hypothetical protein QJS04_geneDACA016789 [Acorus gramineus]